VSLLLYIRDAPRNRKNVAVGTKVLAFSSKHAIDKAYLLLGLHSPLTSRNNMQPNTLTRQEYKGKN
jgi:hypothetical protein